jgi:hypothetical protein
MRVAGHHLLRHVVADYTSALCKPQFAHVAGERQGRKILNRACPDPRRVRPPARPHPSPTPGSSAGYRPVGCSAWLREPFRVRSASALVRSGNRRAYSRSNWSMRSVWLRSAWRLSWKKVSSRVAYR